MTTLKLHLPDHLLKAVRDLAKQENISINQFIMLAVAEKISALGTEKYLNERGKRGSRDKFEQAMSKVPDVGLEERDRL
jgi:hypothetical protein